MADDDKEQEARINFSVSMDPETRADLTRVARKKNQSRSELIESYCREGLEKDALASDQ